ncbi:concanavalin A-like lectin/glucanase domain-containing protein [Xylariales sp. PMI_506]|nr:concanavalin A-like lectin/glucanase domain-containing protein [Xylariales sp. PMI_506]
MKYTLFTLAALVSAGIAKPCGSQSSSSALGASSAAAVQTVSTAKTTSIAKTSIVPTSKTTSKATKATSTSVKSAAAAKSSKASSSSTAAETSVVVVSTSSSAAAVAATTSAAAAASESATNTDADVTTICGQYDTVETGSFIVYQDLWGEANADSGSQCTTVDLGEDSLAWSTSWSWSGGSSDVKSYAHVQATSTQQLSDITSIASTWDWSYTGTSIVADVAFDLFTGDTATGDSSYEIMIWLAALGGAGPISSTGSTIATPTLADTTWDLYSGPNGDTTVYSFVASSEVTSFDGDIMDFLSYLIDNEGLSDSQYLQYVGAGTEAFTGTDAVFTTTSYTSTIA